MSNTNKKMGGSAWQHTVGVFGHPPKMNTEKGNLISTNVHGGSRYKKSKSKCSYGGKKHRKSIKKRGKKTVKRGGSGCGCNSGGSEPAPAPTTAPVTGTGTSFF